MMNQYGALKDMVASDLSAQVAGNSEFALAFYRQLSDPDKNVIFSPYSISTALAMAYAGAKGATAEEMKTVMYFMGSPAATHHAFSELRRRIDAVQARGNAKLAVANRVWPQLGLKLHAEFVELLHQEYESTLQAVDYEHATEDARQTINAWVAKCTQDKIKELLSPTDVTSGTRLTLTNAIYFLADWRNQFEKSMTHNAPFWISAESCVQVPMMTQTNVFKYAEIEDAFILELPYKDDDLAMTILLPRELDGLSQVEQNLSLSAVLKISSAAPERYMSVQIPRFKVNQSVNLKAVLVNMGMMLLFSPGADLTGMLDAQFYFGAAIHQAVVNVDEKGTEAAAATALMVWECAADTSFVADHPFIFFIQERQTGTILFAGRVVDPSKT